MSIIHLSCVPFCFCQTELIFVYLQRRPDMKSHLIWQQTTVSSAEGLHVLIYLVSNRGQWMLMSHDTCSGPSSPPISSLITHMSSLLYHILLLPRIHFPVGSLLLPLMPTLLLPFFQHLWFLPFLSLLLPPVCPLCMVVTGWGSSLPFMRINGTSNPICPISNPLCLLDAICYQHIPQHYRGRRYGQEEGEVRERRKRRTFVQGNEERDDDTNCENKAYNCCTEDICHSVEELCDWFIQN